MEPAPPPSESQVILEQGKALLNSSRRLLANIDDQLSSDDADQADEPADEPAAAAHAD
jgi:hypothetical protein